MQHPHPSGHEGAGTVAVPRSASAPSPGEMTSWPGLHPDGTVRNSMNEPRSRATYNKFSSQEKESEAELDTALPETQL